MPDVTVLSIVGSILAIIIGLWKAVSGKVRRIRKKKKEAYNELKKGVKDRDPSRVTGSFDDVNSL